MIEKFGMMNRKGCGINMMSWRQRYRVILLHLMVHGLVICEKPIANDIDLNINDDTCSLSPEEVGPLNLEAVDLSTGALLHSFSKPASFIDQSHCKRRGGASRTLLDSKYSKHFFITTGGEGIGKNQRKICIIHSNFDGKFMYMMCKIIPLISILFQPLLVPLIHLLDKT